MRARYDRDDSPLLQMGAENARDKRARRPRGKALAFLVLNGVAVLALLSVCVSMHSTISRLEGKLGQPQVNTDAISASKLRNGDEAATDDNKHERRSATDAFSVGNYDRLPMAMLPSKFAVDYVTPRQDQAYRGTCWDFATIGFLEQSYREHGVRRGWLSRDEYVAFSEQAYGVEVMELCSGPPESQQQVDCRVAGDEMWNNSTEGGEVPELYYLRQGLQESVFPQSVCKYFEEGGHDTECPGLEAARAAGNPLKFVVSSMTTKYDDMSVREHLFRKNQAMPLSTPVAMVTHYYPCIGAFANSIHCQPEHCTLCPPDMATTTCCVPLTGGPNRNMEGEFFSHRGMSIEGGHAMLLVGYNDAFMTRDGFTGGLIVKNSWADGPSQGSHSLAYWMQEVSDWEERSVCPNSHNPFNWYQCGQGGWGRSPEEAVQDCLTNETAMFAEVNVQPLHLKCRNPSRCRTDGDFVYFVQNTTDWGDRMTVMCVWEYSPSQPNATRSLCLEPMLELDIARTLRPVEDEVLENDTDRCGFYFIPYEALRHWIAQFQGFFVNSFDIEWHPQSYLANRGKYPGLDYSLLESSTFHQNHSDFLGPFPNAKVVPSFQHA